MAKCETDETCSTNSVECGFIDESLNGLDQEDIRVIEAVSERLIQPAPVSVPYNFTK